MIDILKKITEQKELRGWTEFKLAKKSGLTQSTISSWYRKNMLPNLVSLEAICKAFDMTMAEFFQEKDDDICVVTKEQKKLLEAYNKMNAKQKKNLISFLQSMTETEET